MGFVALETFRVSEDFSQCGVRLSGAPKGPSFNCIASGSGSVVRDWGPQPRAFKDSGSSRDVYFQPVGRGIDVVGQGTPLA